MPTTRTFTHADLAALGVPPDRPEDVEWSDTVLADIHVTVLKYSQQRRAVFIADDDKTYAVTYEAALDMGDFEVDGGPPDNHGWYGDTVTATRVVQRPVVVPQWQDYEPEVHDPHDERTALQQLTDLYEELGRHTSDAQQFAADFLAEHEAELEQQNTVQTRHSEGCDCWTCTCL
ncbi:hypothetical protein [Streptomyces anulatus]|uniref:hypothetical protein n=1 Tax=Streptomyces anulatus TaxID=1892 RepID=UPI00367B30EB